MQCPKCSREMDEVRKLDVVVDSCPQCGGMWLDRGELDKLRDQAREIRHDVGAVERRSDPSAFGDLLGLVEHKSHGHKPHNYKHGSKRKKSVFEMLDIFD